MQIGSSSPRTNEEKKIPKNSEQKDSYSLIFVMSGVFKELFIFYTFD